MCQTKVCGACRETLPLSALNYKDRRRGTLQSKCRNCARAYAAWHYRANKYVYVEKAAEHRAQMVLRNKAHVETLLRGKACHRCSSDKDVLFYNAVQDGTQRVHDAVYGGLSLHALDAAITRSKIWCSACLQQHTISFALAARDVRRAGGTYVVQPGKTNDYRRRAVVCAPEGAVAEVPA